MLLRQRRNGRKLIGKELIYLHQPVIQLVDVHVCQFINILIVDAEMKFLLDVGLDYLALNRSSVSLSGGESQRIRLATLSRS